MAINITYAPNPMLVGQAAHDVGLVDYERYQQEQALKQQAFAEQQRQFDSRQAFSEKELAGNQDQQKFARQQAERDDYLKRYAIQQRAAEEDAQRQYQMMALAQQGQVGLQHDALGLQREAMQQFGQNQREQAGNVSQMDRVQWEAMQKAAAIDEMNLRNAIQKGIVGPDQIDEAYAKLHQKWPRAMVGSEPPPLPEWQDPQKKLEAARQSYPNAPWQIDEKGELGLPRGWNYQMDPEYQKQQQQDKLELEDKKSGSKDQAAEAKMYRDAAHDEMTLRAKTLNEDIDLQTQYQTAKIKLLTSIAAAKSQIAQHKTRPGATPGSTISVDMSDAEAAVAEMEKQLQAMTPPPSMSQQLMPKPIQGSPAQPLTPGQGGGEGEWTFGRSVVGDVPTAFNNSTGQHIVHAATPADVQQMYADGTIKIGQEFVGPDGKLHTRAK